MDIESPPFPKSSTSPVQMYWALNEMYDWVQGQTDWANSEAIRLQATDPPFVPVFGPQPSGDSTRYLNLAVPDMFMSWQTLRAIREKYDEIVRNYEDEESWESDPCVFHRINIVKMAALLLSMAFLDCEKREAKEAELIKKHRKAFFAAMENSFGDMQGFFQGELEDDNEIDFDSLFNPPDAEDEDVVE